MKKKIIRIIATAAGALSILYFLINFILNSFLIPNKIKPLLIDTLESSTGKKTTIETISFSLLKGLSIENLMIHDVISELPFRFSHVYLKLRYVPLFLKKKIIYTLATSRIEKLNIYLEANGSYEINNKTLQTKLYIHEFPLQLLKHLSLRLPFQINTGKSDIKADLSLDARKNFALSAELPLKNVILKMDKISAATEALLALRLSKVAASETLNYNGELTVEKLRLSLPPPYQEIVFSRGKVIFNQEKFEITDTEFTYLEKPYILSGKIILAHNPGASLKLSADNLESQIEALYSERELEIKKAVLKLSNSHIEIQGRIKDIKKPAIDIYLTGVLNTTDLTTLPFKFVSVIDKLSLDSILETELHLTGKIQDRQGLNSLLKIKSSLLKIQGFQLANLSLNLKTAGQNLDAELESDAYGGKLKVELADLMLKEKFPFKARLNIEELSLKKLNTVSLKLSHDLSGNFATEIDCRGELKDIKKISGNGWLEITEGRLWELPIFKGLLGIISLPGGEKNIFREAHGNFAIKNSAVTTPDLQLISDRLTLNTQGGVYFNGDLDLRIKAEFPQQQGVPSLGLDKLQDILLKGAGTLMQEIQISGSLKKPEYKVVPISVENIFQNILP
jgi:hypothetical protein